MSDLQNPREARILNATEMMAQGLLSTAKKCGATSMDISINPLGTLSSTISINFEPAPEGDNETKE